MKTIPILASLAAVVALAAGACDGELPSDQTSSTTSSSAATTSTGSAGGGGAGGAGGGAPTCSKNPMTHLEIINACTDAQQIDAMPVLPLLNPDGSLPPLP